MGEILGLILLVLIYWWASQMAGSLSGKELHLLEAARETLQNHRFFYPSYNFNDTLQIPSSPLLATFISIVFQFFSTTLLSARIIVLILSLLTLLIFYVLGSRLFHPSVGALSAGFALATWGFFSNSHALNGAVLYLMLVLIIFLLFFHWFDSAFRSRTFARSLYVHFALIGFTLGLTFCTHGIPGLLFPVVVMISAVALSNRIELLKDVHYPWLAVPFGVVILLWSIMGILSVGPLAFLKTLFPISPNLAYLGEPILYFLPSLPLIIPGLFSKDMWSRALMTYHKALFLMGAWVAWSLIFLLLFGNLHEAFSLLLMMPALLWLGFYLNEIFRNPIIPFSLQITVDSMILFGLIASVCSVILTFQIVPPDLRIGFIAFSFVLTLSSMALVFLRDLTISRALPMYIIPCSLLLCILAKGALEPLFLFQPAQTLSPLISSEKLNVQGASILEWTHTDPSPSITRFLTPLKNSVTFINDQDTLEALIQTRQGPMYLLIPEDQFYSLPYSVREEGYPLGTSWRWRKPLTLWTLVQALYDETLDFNTLSEPMMLFEVPTIQSM